MLPIASKPCRAELTLASGVAYVIAVSCLYVGVTIFTDPELRQDYCDFFWQCTDEVQGFFERVGNSIHDNYPVLVQWERDEWSKIANAIADYFTPERFGNSSGITFGQVQCSSSNSIVDFTTDNTLYFTIPAISENFQEVHYTVNDCDFSIYFNTPLYKWADITTGNNSYSQYDNRNCGSCMRIESLGCNLALCSNLNRNNFVANSVYSTNAFSTWRDSYGQLYFNLGCTNIYDSSQSFSWIVNNDIRFVDVVNHTCYYPRAIDNNYYGRYALVNASNDSLFENRIFDSYMDLLEWYFNTCGLSFIRPSDFTAAVNPNVVIDTDKVQQRLDEVADMPVDDTLPMVIPTTYEQYQDLVAHPENIVTPTDAVYTGDIAMPTVSGNLWKTKFPFCLPFDIINLFSGFSAEAQAPSFHLLVLPANSFGLSNDDIYFDIDFSPYNQLVQILRFFIAIAFVVFLVVTTRKLIGS